SLKEMSRYVPTTADEFLMIKGVGEKKLNQYGKAFLHVLQAWSNAHPSHTKKVKIGTSPVKVKKGFYVNCWGEIKISLQFITLFGFHSGGNFSLSAGG